MTTKAIELSPPDQLEHTVDFDLRFDNDVPAKLLAIGLAGAESVPLQETGDGTTYQAVYKDGAAVTLTATNPSVSINVVGSYRIVKPSGTAGNVGTYLSKRGYA